MIPVLASKSKLAKRKKAITDLGVAVTTACCVRGDDALLSGEGDDVLYGEAGDDLWWAAQAMTQRCSRRYTDYQFAVTDETLSIIGADGTDTLPDHLMAMLKDQQRRTSNALSSMMAYTNESGRLALVIATQCCQQTHHATH